MTTVIDAPADTPIAPSTPIEDISADDIAQEIGNVGDLKRKSKVRAFTALPGVPEGTPGRVSLANGWDTWIRYRVLFENGVDLGSINREHLVPLKQYDEFVAKRATAIASGAFDKVAVEESTDAGDGEAAAAGGGGDVVVNGVTIPGRLLEMSKAARARLAG